MTHAYVYAAARTPFGRFEGALAEVRPDGLAATALAGAGITWAEVSVVELNEAFAVQSLACVDGWPGEGLVDAEIVNAKGGAIAIGHPLGASGARILGALVHELRRRGGGYGCAAICSGGGQGDALLIEV